jgi:hypothetical protein
VKHEPKTMKAQADKMHKSGAISEKERDRLHKKANVEIENEKGRSKAAKPPVEEEGDADATQTPAKRKAATKAPVMRGQPLDEEEKDD